MNAKMISGLENVPPACKGGVLTIGNFDGVHIGHQSILRAGRELARSVDSPLVTMTFERPPDLVLRPADTPKRLTPLDRKVELLIEAGADYVVIAETNPDLLAMDPAAFVEDIIVARFAPRHMVEGPNFFFGRKRAGNVVTLESLGAEAGFDVHVVEPVAAELPDGPEQVSSTLIRQMVAAGRVEQAGRCLSRPYAMVGTIIPGEGRGRVLDFPTANIDPVEQVLPADGVYAGRARIADQCFVAAISIGNKPTFQDEPRTYVEAFLIDADGDYYGQPMTLEITHRVRDQQRFDGLESLRGQIAKDVQRVRSLYQ